MLAEIKAVNLLLYLKYDSFTRNFCDETSILCFNNKKIVAVDEFRYDREERYNMQKKFGIRPYYLSQRVFHELLRASCESNVKIYLRQIMFADDAVSNDPEYEELEELIRKRNYEGVYDATMDLLEEYDTEIKSVKINYSGYDFKLTNKGVIETYAPQSTINTLVNDSIFNRIILGIG